MTTSVSVWALVNGYVVEAYRLDRYDNLEGRNDHLTILVVEAYRLDRYDNPNE